MINPAETWVRIAKPSVDGIRRLGARAGIETVPEPAADKEVRIAAHRPIITAPH